MHGRIGFVDFDLDNFHANVYLKLIRGELAQRGFTVSACTAMQQDSSRAWAERNSIPYAESVADMDSAVDYYAVLAPSNPEVHEELCEQVLPRGKATYVDKTFAPDLAAAERIFDLADRSGVPMQTSSALRYTNVQDRVREIGPEAVHHMVTWGAGSSFDEYAIHPLELAVSCMGSDAQRLCRRGSGDQSQLLIDFSADRTAVVNVYTHSKTPFAATVTTHEGTEYIPVDSAVIFRNTAAAMLDLFESGKATIDRQQTLMIRRILDAAARPEALGRFIAL